MVKSFRLDYLVKVKLEKSTVTLNLKRIHVTIVVGEKKKEKIIAKMDVV